MMLKIWRTFFMIYNASRIPRLPRMLASDYETIPRDVVDVMRRLGCRDPRGVRAAMKRYGVNTIPELVEILEYQNAKRHVKNRFWLAVGRVVGGMDEIPHKSEIIASTRKNKRNQGIVEIRQRVKIAKEVFK